MTLHRTRHGRKGHTVTLIKLDNWLDDSDKADSELAALSRTLAKAMGCGARVEGSNAVLQGDMIDRLKEWFAKAGAKKIVVSGSGSK